MIALNETFLDDDQDMVTLAAEDVLRSMQQAGKQGVHAYPPAYDIHWIDSWKERQIEMDVLPYDAEGMPVFEAAFEQRDDIDLRRMATVAIGQLGLVTHVDGIYEALRDRDDLTRDFAYRTLGELQRHLGKPLPAP